jgi:uncharacterized membrane protein
MPNIHPIVVHFPVALLTTAFVFDLIGRIWKKEECTRVGWWTQLAGTIGLAAAAGSGLLAEKTVPLLRLAKPFIEMHEQLAFASTGFFALLLFWRIAGKTRLPERYATLYLMILFGGVVCLWAGAWYGGEMVYRIGVGVRTVTGGPGG